MFINMKFKLIVPIVFSVLTIIGCIIYCIENEASLFNCYLAVLISIVIGIYFGFLFDFFKTNVK
jgi:hypothetical protein